LVVPRAGPEAGRRGAVGPSPRGSWLRARARAWGLPPPPPPPPEEEEEEGAEGPVGTSTTFTPWPDRGRRIIRLREGGRAEAEVV